MLELSFLLRLHWICLKINLSADSNWVVHLEMNTWSVGRLTSVKLMKALVVTKSAEFINIDELKETVTDLLSYWSMSPNQFQREPCTRSLTCWSAIENLCVEFYFWAVVMVSHGGFALTRYLEVLLKIPKVGPQIFCKAPNFFVSTW